MNSETLLAGLTEARSYDTFYKKYKENLKQKEYSKTWKAALADLKIKKSDVITKAEIGYTYFYDILRGDKHPTRDTLVKIFLAAELDYDTCQKILYTYDWAYLSPDIKRDSIIIFAIHNHLDLSETNYILKKYNEHTLKA